MKVVLISVVLLQTAACVNILFISPLPSPSHHLWNKVLSMALIKKGYNVTMLTHNVEENPTPNFTVITMEGIYKQIREKFSMIEFAKMNALETMTSMYKFSKFICEYSLDTKGLELLLNYSDEFVFDLIIFDVTGGSCLYPLIELFKNPPVIAVTAFLLPHHLSYEFGNHILTSYMPHHATTFTSKMNTFERLLNFFYTYFDVLLYKYVQIEQENDIAQKRFGGSIRHVQDIQQNISLLLANIDPVLNLPIPLPPNIIPVGGLHVRPGQALPKDLQHLIDNAEHGIILFSLGTNVRSSDLSRDQLKTLLEGFKRLPQIILWKYEADDLGDLPKNVVIRKWMPQNDILGHSNVKLFISHGGALSTQEAMYHGVPVIGIPFFADQFVNIRQMMDKGLAKQLDIQRKPFTSDYVYDTILNVLNTPSYTVNVKKISKLYRDQPQSALDRALFWIEYVMRHGTAEHLNTAARDMPGYQTANLDILAVATLGIVLLFSFLTFLMSLCSFCLKICTYKRK